MPRPSPPGSLEIDTLLGGWERVTAGYLIEGAAPVLVETGSQSSVPVLLAALDRLGGRRRATSPGWPSPTSTSTTPAGSATWPGRSRRPPSTCTRRGPGTWSTRPGWSTRRPGSTGRCSTRSTAASTRPPAERIHVLEDGEEIDVGPDRVLVAVDSPGHAKHHLACTTRRAACSSPATPSGCGCPTPGCCGRRPRRPTSTSTRPSTRSQRFAERRPAGIALAHYGLVPDPLDTAEEAEETLRRWAEVAERRFGAGEDIAAALAAPSPTNWASSTRPTGRSSRR